MNLLFLLKPKATVAYLSSECTMRQGLEKMRAHGYTAIPVIAPDGKYVGTVSEGDFLWTITDMTAYTIKDTEKIRLTEIMRSKRDHAVSVNADMNELLLRIMEQNFVPVVDDRNVFIGIVTRRDIINYYYEKELVTHE